MALTTLAQGQNATITFPAPFDGNMVFNNLSWSTDITVHNVTGVKAGVADTFSQYENSCLGDIRGRAIGVPYEGSTFGFGCNSTITLTLNTSGTVQFKIYDYRFTKTFRMFDVTAVGDTEKKWTHGLPTYVWQARGYIDTTTAGFDDLTALGVLNTGTAGPGREIIATFVPSQIGTIGAATEVSKIARISKVVPFKRGGDVEVTLSAIWNGTVTYTAATGQDLNIEDATPTVGSMTVDMDDGVSVAHQIVVSRMTIDDNPQLGSPTRIVLDWRYT